MKGNTLNFQEGVKLLPPFGKVVMTSWYLCKSFKVLLLYSFPLGLLDAYTEVPGTKEGMSDSDKFKEGYKKKGKGKVKNPPPKKVEETAEEVEEVAKDGKGPPSAVAVLWTKVAFFLRADRHMQK